MKSGFHSQHISWAKWLRAVSQSQGVEVVRSEVHLRSEFQEVWLYEILFSHKKSMCMEMGADSQGHLHLYSEFEDRLCSLILKKVCVWDGGC